MPRYLPEPVYRHGSPTLTAVLLINLGTPAAPTAKAVRSYLREFLSDPRVVEIPRPLWWIILNGIILQIRPRRSAEKYASVWTTEGSPLKVHVERQSKLLRGFLGQAGHRVRVDYAMRYGQPSIAATLSRLKAEGCTRILLLPLYPQYAASTTATAFDAVGAWLKGIRNQPEIRSVRSFADHPGYIQALAASVREHWMTHGRPTSSYRLVMSFHGLPRYTLDEGDPYHCFCHKSARLVAEELGMANDAYQVSFQSRFGPQEWLQPYTDKTLEAWAEQGVGSVDAICPGFAVDCLETLEEIAEENRETFLEAGGKTYRYIPCLNDSPDQMTLMIDLVTANLSGWQPPAVDDVHRRVAAFEQMQAKKGGAVGGR